MTKYKKEQILSIDMLLIDEPHVADRMHIDMDGISELAQSIDEVGLLQAILLRKKGERYEVVAGHRRFLAHKKLGRRKINATVKEMTDQEAALARATENLGRENLTPVEEAVAYSNLINIHKLSLDEIGKKFGKSAGLIKRRMDLLKMPPQLRDAVHKKQISISVAEEFWPITDLTVLDYYLSFALEGGCTQAVARSWCKDWKDTVRRSEAGTAEGGQVFSPQEPRPVYVSCDLCTGPMEIGQEIVLRVCNKCFKVIKENM